VRREQEKQAVRAKNEVESHAFEYKDMIDQEKVDRVDIVTAMTREYKDMQEFLILKNNELENKIQKIQDEMGLFLQGSVYFI
jgi:protein-tyrosine-phosphatase